jgi:hypothetical protein
MYTNKNERVKMHLRFVTLIWIVFPNISYGDRLSESPTESYNSRYSTVGNENIPLEYDCAFRAFTIEMAAYQCWNRFGGKLTQLNRNIKI